MGVSLGPIKFGKPFRGGGGGGGLIYIRDGVTQYNKQKKKIETGWQRNVLYFTKITRNNITGN